MKIATVIGARPQFIKAAMVSRAIREQCDRIKEVLVHTGQHYDYQMSQVFFDQLELAEPNYHLGIGSGNHGDQTGRMLAGIENVLMDEKPDIVLVYGDTNSTLAGTLAAVKLHIPVGHVEGGMRSFNRRMPEEINRVLADHIAKWHFCATETAVDNLRKEGITESVHLVGDVMHEAVMLYKNVAEDKSDILTRLGIKGRRYAVATVHRAENTDDPQRVRNIIQALVEISKEMLVVLPLHPRTRKVIEGQWAGDFISSSIKLIDPVSYLDMLQLEQHASVILTDSGGMQKEAFWLNVPCITVRDETEWIETVRDGYNIVAGAGREDILKGYQQVKSKKNSRSCQKLSSSVSASDAILDIILA